MIWLRRSSLWAWGLPQAWLLGVVVCNMVCRQTAPVARRAPTTARRAIGAVCLQTISLPRVNQTAYTRRAEVVAPYDAQQYSTGTNHIPAINNPTACTRAVEVARPYK